MASKTKDKEIIDEAKKLTKDLLKLIGIEAKVVAVGEDDLVKVDINGDDLGLLIGYRGENLESLQLVLGVILNKKLNLDPWRPVLLDVGGWRQQSEESLRNLIAKEVEKLSSEAKSVEMPPMPPAQRRTVHLLITDYDGLTSESVGEEPNRRVVIKKVD
ncbi:MAG: R3H domain-containing nucleic acid-binding protein [bacterium]|nr:R3H domain-containing nucleic acid-binding protein [bacterium]